MYQTIKTLNVKKLIGKRVKMSLANDKTYELWSSFMPRRTEINNNIGTLLYSVKVYDPKYFTSFNYETEFDKWAAIEVTDFDTVPEGMETIVFPEGLYVVFDYKGLNTDDIVYEYIFKHWLPISKFTLDHRPHFEILGAKYKNNSIDSEEEIWIPVKRK